MRALLAVVAFGLALPASAAQCPQERAIYSLGEATMAFEADKNPYTGWAATLRAPSAPVRFHVVASNGVVRHYFMGDGSHLQSEIELIDAKGRRTWGEAGKPAAPAMRLPNFGPRGTWRLTGCSKP